MKIAILGSGMVGNAIASKLTQAGHQVMMGSRTARSDAGQKWLDSVKGKGKIGTFADAARFGGLIISCTNGANALDALRQAGTENLRGKILVDVSNPLDTSQKPPTLLVCNTDSLGERIQREFPEARVVKALNTVNCAIMIAPSRLPEETHLPICGNDAKSKDQVAGWLSEWFGWNRQSIIDLGDITAARGMEMWMPIWLRLWNALGTLHFNIRLVREVSKLT